MREKAIELLQYYFAVAMGMRSQHELSSDYRAEIAEIVDSIISAARRLDQLESELCPNDNMPLEPTGGNSLICLACGYLRDMDPA